MSIARRWLFYKAFLETEFSSSAPTLRWRLRSLLKGHPSKSLVMLEDRAYREHDYFNFTLERRRKAIYNLRLDQALHNKLDQKLWLDCVMPSVAPPASHYIAGRKLISLAGDDKILELDGLLQLLAEKGELFLKPAGEGKGKGAMRLAQLPDGILLNGNRIAARHFLDSFSNTSSTGYIVCDIIRQGPWSEAFFPATLNTLRVLTGTHFSDHRPILLAATMKMGRPATYPTDNWQSGKGGIAARVDVDTGVLAAGLFYNAELKKRELRETHPESGVQIRGAAVPGWQAVKSTMLQLASLLPYPGLVGWDVALMPTGIVIVEANTSAGLDIHQCHGSLKQTPDQQSFWAEMRM